jgi:hypothetical protein
METTTNTNYVTVFPATNGRKGWMVAVRTGSVIDHIRLEGAASFEPDKARAAAEALFPDKLVYMAGDPVKPWETTAVAA